MTSKFDKLYSNLVSKYGNKAVEDGYDTEKEHGTDPMMRLKTAQDHLEEYPEYYTELKKMEKKLKKKPK